MYLNKINNATKKIEHLFDRLFPLPRSITGDAYRESLKILSEYIPFKISKIPSGKKVFQWTVPKEWKITRLKFVTSYNDIKLNDNTDPEYEFTYIEISDVDSRGRIGPGTVMNFEESPSRARRVLEKNAIIISTVRT